MGRPISEVTYARKLDKSYDIGVESDSNGKFTSAISKVRARP
ncbi:MAG TPA: hypothetical protein VJZ68_02880 [Nitrososphaera sp.]|nr:hypothetical protein [Nitrososphaera sp.]